MPCATTLKLVVIDLESGDNAQVIFETLNHRDTPLLAAALIKNLVFQVAAGQGHDVEDLYRTQWRELDSDYWRGYLRQGRLRRPRIGWPFDPPKPRMRRESSGRR